MKTIKFISVDKREHEFASAVRKNVAQYFKSNGLSMKGNKILYAQTVVMLSLYIAPFILIMMLTMNAAWALLIVVVMGIGMAGIGMCVMHDAVHGSYSQKDWINKIMGSTLYLLGSNVLNWKIQHNVLHHTYTNIEGLDQDIASRGPIRL